MQYPMLRAVGTIRQTVDTFLGYDHNLRITDGAFYDMENLTSDCYPVLSPRKKRSLFTDTLALGIIPADIMKKGGDGKLHPEVSLCYVDARSQRVVVGGETTGLTVKLGHKQLVAMGAYVLVFPDKTYINTLNPEDCGSMDAQWKATGEVELSACTLSGNDAAGESSTYIKLTATGIGKDFQKYDGVTISGITASQQAKALNGSAVIYDRGEDYIVVAGVLDGTVTQDGGIQVARTVPDMDFIIECGNRLWGCRYGVDENGQVVNEIYCSKLGDFKNWSCFMGLSTDSWVGSVGSDGPFTGAVTHLGHPLFFKENCLHKVYVSATGAHQIMDTPCRGVQIHCGKSLAVVGETLFYKARSGVMAYDGAFPQLVSRALGSEQYGGGGGTMTDMGNGQYIRAVGGAVGNKYYISMSDSKGDFQLFVYDTAKGLWHREDKLRALHMCSVGSALYAVDGYGNILLLTGGGENDAEDVIGWYAVTGDLGLDSPDKKYISRLTARLELAPGSEVSLDVQYDHSGVWEPLCTMYGSRLGSFPVTVRPRRCDHLRLRIRGKGEAKLYSLTKTITEGSDRG